MRTAARYNFLKLLVLGFALSVALPLCHAQAASSDTIQAMKLVSGRSGWLVANDRLFWTDSVGAQWAEITPVKAGMSSIDGAFFSAEGRGWTVLSSPDRSAITVAYTTDKGQHWTYAAVASPFSLATPFNGKADVTFVDGQNGWIMLGIQSSSAFRRGLLLRTIDGGLHWTQAPVPPVGGDLYFTDATHGWTGPGPNGDELFSTSNAGQTWQVATLPLPSADLSQVHSTVTLPTFTDASNGTLLRTYLGDTGTTLVRYQTADAGATWHVAAPPAALAFSALAADGTLVTRSLAETKASLGKANPAVEDLKAVSSSFSTGSTGLVLFAGGGCDTAAGLCTQTKSLKGTLDGGRTFFSLGSISGLELESTTQTVHSAKTRGTTAPPVGLGQPAGPTPNSSFPVVDVMGFDACTLPTVAQMQTWITSSPYVTAGLYIGGSEFACRSGLAAFTSSYTASVLAQGWEIMPIWVGPQAPGAGFTYSISTDPATATAQGVAEADSAIDAMLSLGMNQGSTVIYDMEAYTYTNATYVAATTAFLNGWDSELHAYGYLASVYSGHYEFENWLPGMVTPAIDTIWFTYYFNSGVSCGPTCSTVYPTGVSSFTPLAPYWLNHHRSRQTSSAFNSTYGGLTLNVDEDYTDAAFEVATNITLTAAKSGTGSGTVATATINNSLDTSSDTAISCGPTCTTASALFAPTDTVTLTATPVTGSTFVSWSGCTSVSGSTCTIATTASSTVTANFSSTALYALTVTKAGTGSGTVVSGDGHISCGTTCSASYAAGTAVTLTATPAAGSVFGSWSGCTTTTGTTCLVTTGSAAESVTATFNTVPTYALTVAKAGTGSGTVVSGDGSISCGTTCSASYVNGTAVTLTATPATGSTFVSWSGCTTTTGTTCQVTTGTAAENVTVTFNTVPTYALTVAKSGTGAGTVVSGDGSISCGATCSAAYPNSTAVTLTATPATGSVFVSWSGCTTTSGTTCLVTTGSAAESVTVTFNTVPTYALTVTKAGTGTGTVVSGDGSISCGAICSASYPNGTAVMLTATPAAGSTFGGWSGCTTTSGTTCLVTTGSTAENVAVTFNIVPTYALTIAKTGTGSGTVVSGDGAISCGTTCSASYASGIAVTLTATPATGSIFVSWSGCTTTSGTTCLVTTGSAPENVTATFNVAPTYSAALSATTLSIIGGNTATDTLTISPQVGYTGSFSALSCTGLPASATCAFSPATLTALGDGAQLTSILTITTTPVVTASIRQPSTIFYAGLLLPAFLLPWVLRRRKRLPMRSLTLLAFTALAIGISQLAGCGGSGSAPSNTGTTNPPFSGTINVSITSPTGVKLLPLQLNVTSK